MNYPPLTVRLVLLLCAPLLLCVQVLGLHYHRHAGAFNVPAQAVSVHLWDAGLHVPEAAVEPQHTAMDSHAAHSGTDMDVDLLAAGLTKLMKLWLAPGIFLVAILWLVRVRLPSPVGNDRLVAARHPDLFVLRPPSNAPPLKLSLDR